MKYVLIITIAVFGLLSCQQQKSSKSTSIEKNNIPEVKNTRAKFEPADGQCILFVGQELAAIGGVAEYNDGYLDHFKRPGGFTMYTNFSPGDTMFGNVTKGLDGVFETDKWGDGPSNMSMQLADEDFENMALAIGLWLVNHEEEVANGTLNHLVDSLGNFIKGLAPRPVFLRIGYEFSGAWNHYDREHFLTAYKRIKDRYDEMGIDNVAYVWQSHGWEEPMEHLESWYPGDEYVDWCGTSFFSRWAEINMIEFARKHNKPVFIAEATPTISTDSVKTTGMTEETILSNPAQGEEAWEKWFEPFFKTVEDNPDVVKAVSYINCHWKANPMWFDNPTFKRVDARLHINPTIAKRWKEQVYRDRYLQASPQLYDLLGQNK